MQFRFCYLVLVILLWNLPGGASNSDEEVVAVTPSTLIMDFNPRDVTLVEEVVANITLNVRDNGTSDDFSNRPWMVYAGRLTVVSSVPYNLIVVNGSDAFAVTPCDFLEDKNYTLTLQANSLGYANLQVYWEPQTPAAVFNLTECYGSLQPANWTAPIAGPTDTDLQQDGGSATDQVLRSMQKPIASDDESDSQEEEENEPEVEEPQPEDESREEAEQEPEELHEEEEEQQNEEDELIVEHQESREAEDQENPINEHTDTGVQIHEGAQRDEREEFPDLMHLFPDEDPLDSETDVQSGAEEQGESPTTTEAIETTTMKKKKKKKNKKKNEKPMLLANQTRALDQQPADSSKSLLLEEHVLEPEQTAVEPPSIEQKPDPPPKPREVEKNPPKPNFERGSAIYDQGVTFLFKRSQELTAEEPEPIVSKVLLSDDYKVKIIRYAGTLDTVFLVVVSLMVMTNVMMMGCQIQLPIVWAILKKPIGPAVGFFSQFAFMPLASYVLGLLLLGDANLRLGLFTLGCSPGGNGSNFWTLLLKGDLNLSMTMTFISTTCSLFMMPLWLYTLGQTILEDSKIGIPFSNLIFSLFSFICPVAIGVAVRRYRPKVADLAKKCIRPFTGVLLIILITLSIWNASYIFRLMTWQMLVSGICIAWGGYVFGAFMAWVFRQNRAQIIAISIETAIQNPGITFMVLRLTLPQPESDISSVAPMAQLCVTSVPLLLTLLVVTIYRKCCRKGKDKQKQQQEEASKNDIDSTHPLMIDRTTSLVPGPSKEPGHAPSASYANHQDHRITPPPPYPGVSMYAQVDDKELEKTNEKTFAKQLINKQESYDAVPPRNLDHTYENFRNGPDPLGESVV